MCFLRGQQLDQIFVDQMNQQSHPIPWLGLPMPHDWPLSRWLGWLDRHQCWLLIEGSRDPPTAALQPHARTQGRRDPSSRSGLRCTMHPESSERTFAAFVRRGWRNGYMIDLSTLQQKSKRSERRKLIISCRLKKNHQQILRPDVPLSLN